MNYRNLLPLAFLFSFVMNAKGQTTQSLLLKKVDSIPMPAVPDGVSFFTLVNEQPETIAMSKFEIGQYFKANAIVTSKLGKGKLLLFGASAYFRSPMLEDKNVIQLLTNSLNWAGAGKKGLRIAVTENADQALRSFLAMQHASVYTINDLALKKGTDILILSEDVNSTKQLKQLEDFISNGGTLIFGSPYSDMYNKRDSTKTPQYADIRINKLLAKAGVVNPQTLVIQSPADKVLVTDSVPDYLRVYTMLPRLLIQHRTQFDDNANQYFVNPTLDLVFKYNEANSPVINHIKQFFNVPDVMPVPSTKSPVLINTALLKTVTQIGYTMYELQQDFANHPEAKFKGYQVFPGDVPATAARVTQTVTIPVKVGTQGLYDMPSVYYRPHSTGLYIPAGEKVKITINTNDIKQQLKAQIGVHDDNLMHLDQLTRIGTDLTKTFNLDKETTEIYSPYGGLLLINIAETTKLKTVIINVAGAVKAPYFKLGETNEQEWITSIRSNPAPWAELATDNIVLTVPSYRIRNLNNPVKLMQFWDEVMDADADLAIISRKRVHPERIIVDAEVAYGALFTLPQKIVAPDDESCGMMLDEAYMRLNGLWGHFHELGHRHQFSDLDYPGTGEVTVNLYTMYVFDKVLHKGLFNHEGMANMGEVLKGIKIYLANDPSYEKWSNDPFLALSMYIQIIDRFGWDAIKAANTVYRNLPRAQYPKTDQDRRDLWFTTICKATNSNLAHFFDVWKIPVSDDAKKQALTYSTWFPKELDGY